ncbi:MAG: elongation factor P maturation arginine rhamnosyltransferase EarP [Burkholderiales bacterium]|nr:elongation factor P maturation arginine rhamnosyltransferase EarP [Burkholderiales bacterium]
MLWDIFCRVIDNFGDIGVCWRLATGLAGRGIEVRLWLDDARALAWMAPEGAPRVQVLSWPESAEHQPGEVVIEAFGCDPPTPFVQRMAQRRPAPVWINLEYLSAEDYVERSHGLRSPQFNGPGAGLDKWFFYPGFTPRTGGLMHALPRPDARRWLAGRGWGPHGNEQVVLLFCYDNPMLPALLRQLEGTPTLLLAAPGAAQQALAQRAAGGLLRGVALPWLTQAEFDTLLQATDLNLVRGEDSFVQAQWSGAPFVWQLYPQHDQAHAAKLQAFLDRFTKTAPMADATPLAALWRAWNGLGPWPERWPAREDWQRACRAWRDQLMIQIDLITQLQGFVDERR